MTEKAIMQMTPTQIMQLSEEERDTQKLFEKIDQIKASNQTAETMHSITPPQSTENFEIDRIIIHCDTSFTQLNSSSQCLYAANGFCQCLICDNNQIEIPDFRPMCCNCCINLWVNTNALRLISHSLIFDSYYQALINITHYPQIMYHISKNKSLYTSYLDILFNVALCDKFNNFKLFYRNISFPLSYQLEIKVRIFMCLSNFILFCRRRKHILQFIKLRNGIYFHKVVKFMQHFATYEDVHRFNQNNLNENDFKEWTNVNKFSHIACVIAYRIVFKYRKYFDEKSRNSNKKYYKLVRILLEIIPTEIAFELPLQRKKMYEHYMETLQKYDVLCNNRKCKNGKQTMKWYKCGQCKMVYYCSRHCQKKDWNRFNHRMLCNRHYAII
eukprot:283873_1